MSTDTREISAGEQALREDTAAAFRLLDKYGMSDLTNGSVVARLPGEENWFLTHPHGLFFHEMKASDLIRVDMDGNAIDVPGTPTNFAVCRPATSIFRARPKLKMRPDHTFSDEEYNTYSCPWHHNITAAICSFRTAKALKSNAGSTFEISNFRWHNSTPFTWHSKQLLDLGLMEPGQWF